MENPRLYNSTNLYTFIEYINTYYPNINISEVLEYSHITELEISDSGQWFTQEQIDRFYEILEKKTGNPNLAREAGRFTVQSKSTDILRQYTSGFVTPSVAYWMVGKIASTISKHNLMKMEYVTGNKILITSTPKEGITEKPYQCENRIGLFEALAKYFTNEYAQVEHNECLHKQASSCRYIVSWKKTPATLWKIISRYSSLLGAILLIVLLFLIPFKSWAIYALIIFLGSFFIFLVAEKFTNRDLSKSVEGQRNITEKYIKQFETRYNELTLVKEIGEAASSILDPHELLNFVTTALQKHLQFKRGMIMLANPERTKLIYTVGYGYAPHEESLLKKANFSLGNPQSQGIFYLAYHEQKPFIINDTKDIENNISERSVNFMKALGVNSFICVPIVYEGKSEGILAVDNSKSDLDVPATQSDLSLLTGIAQQIGISLSNALAHKRIKESEERFRNLSDNSPDIIYQLDLEGRFSYVNAAWKDVLGHNIIEIIGKYITDFIRQEDHTAFYEILQNIINNKATIRDRNFIILNNKGLPHYITFTGAPDIDAEGSVIGVLGTLKDISRLRIMEAQLLQASKMEAVGTLTGGIAHDFNNIIQAIMGYNQIMISGRTGNETETSYLKSIGELIQRSRELVGQLMLFGKKVEPLSKIVNINEEIISMHNLLTKSIPKMIDIQTNLQEDIFPLIADSTQIGQIIMNLVINARDAMGDNGKITISTNNIVLQKNMSIADLNIPAGNYIELTVSDTGSGIKKELLQHIFEPFFTTKEAGKGTGLGLAVVHGIVKNHDGFIYCESAPDKGTTFRILFPAITSGKPQQKVQEKTVKIPRGKEKLLVVDDEKNILETVKETLSFYGYKVMTAESAEQALKVYTAQKDKIKLVLLDLNMPGRGGKKCLIDLLAINKSAKVLMTSGYSTSQQIEDLSNAGAAGFINKPYRPEDLLLSIRKIIDNPVNSKQV